jgi:hypothetical protein
MLNIIMSVALRHHFMLTSLPQTMRCDIDVYTFTSHMLIH